MNNQAPYSTGGLGTDLAVAIAPGNKTAKALGTVSELSLDLLTGSAGRLATNNSLGPLNRFAMERVFVRNPTELGSLANSVQWGDLLKVKSLRKEIYVIENKLPYQDKLLAYTGACIFILALFCQLYKYFS